MSNPTPNTDHLQPPWQAGVSGNPSGRKAGVTYPGDWMRNLMDLTQSQLGDIAQDPDVEISKRQAAQQLLDGIDDDLRSRGAVMDRLLDRTEGKPKATIEATVTKLSAAELLHQAREEAQIGGAEEEESPEE